MGIRFYCPNGHKLNVKSFQAGMKGICPYCGASMQIPTESTRQSSKEDQSPQDMAPVEIIGVEPDEPMPAQPVAGMPAAQPQPNTRPPLQPDPETLAAQALGTPVAQPLGTPPAQPAAPAAAASAPSPTPAMPVGTVPTETMSPAQAPMGTTPTASQPAAAPAEPAPAAPTEPAAPDPLAEAPDAVWYVRPPGGGQFGPAPSDVMRTWIDEGRVAPEAIVWREGWRDWREASSVFPRLAPDPTVAGLEKIAKSDPAATSPTARVHHGGGGRGRSNRFNTAIITVLVFAVIVLFGVFVWVLTTQPAP